MGGVHPWMTNSDGMDVHPSMADALLCRLNGEGAKLAELAQYGYGNDVPPQLKYFGERKTRFERTLQYVRENVYFVEGLTYVRLLDLAKALLREAWNHVLARTLAQRAYPGFQELRSFLKAKDGSLKLSGYGDLDQYNLGRVLGLDDFEGQESILISEAMPSLNFRRAHWLASVTDGQGRLRLTPGIRKVTVTTIPQASDYLHVTWHVERNGETCRFRPEIGKSEAKRARAREFAETWREDEGRLCFSTSLTRLTEMEERREVVPSFPTLSYTYSGRGPIATASVSEDRVPAYFIGSFHGAKSNGETLREILREHSVSMSGNKAKLLQKLARLAAKEYSERLPTMDRFFTEHRFVRINTIPAKADRLSLLEDVPLLRNLLLTMYALSHLRGSAILDPVHHNNTYTEEQLAHALLTGKVGFTGAFLRVT